MQKDTINNETPAIGNVLLADGLFADNPFRKIINWNVGDIQEYMKREKIPYTKEQFQEFHRVYDDCDECGHWYRNSDFSSFTLGMVLCKRCNY